jgi:mRNA-degrading endonuclease RelE of RelBE toxin-antitoxin system
LQLLSESITGRKLVYKISFCLQVLKESDRHYLFKKRNKKCKAKLNSSLERIMEESRYTRDLKEEEWKNFQM